MPGAVCARSHVLLLAVAGRARRAQVGKAVGATVGPGHRMVNLPGTVLAMLPIVSPRDLAVAQVAVASRVGRRGASARRSASSWASPCRNLLAGSGTSSAGGSSGWRATPRPGFLVSSEEVQQPALRASTERGRGVRRGSPSWRPKLRSSGSCCRGSQVLGVARHLKTPCRTSPGPGEQVSARRSP